MQQGIKALVVACNTATSVAIEDLRLKYRIPIIGMEPAIKPAVATNKNSNKRVLVTATALTLKEEKLKKLIAKLDKEHRVDLLPLPELVRFSESYEFNELAILPYLHEQLSRYELKKYETIVLGCTHFSFYKDMFRKIAPISVDIIDGTLGTFKNLKRTLVKMKAINEGNGEITYFNSGSEVIDSESLLKYSKLLHRLDEVESYYPLPGAFN